MPMPKVRTGLLIIRAYAQPESSLPLRAQISLTRDVATGIERTMNLADPDAAAEVVRAWLASILDRDQPG